MIALKQIKQVFKGVIIGGGMILPGVSGGVLAVILGVYEKILDAFADFFKNVKKNTIFLTPIIIGVVIGLFLFGKLLFFLFDYYPSQAKFAFMGLILGGVPAIYKEATKKKEKKINIIGFICALIFSLVLFVFGRGTFNIDFSVSLDGPFAFILIFITGFIYVAGKIIPGISSSFMLMLIGMYEFLLNILNDPFGLSKYEALQAIPFILGLIVGGIIIVKFIRYLFKNHYILTYSIIIGFVLGSIAAIYPGFSFDLKGLICIVLFALALLISYRFSLLRKDE